MPAWGLLATGTNPFQRKIRPTQLYQLPSRWKAGNLQSLGLRNPPAQRYTLAKYPTVNGREFTSDDVAYHYHRLYGGGHGFTTRGPGAHYQFTPLESITAIDRYTVAFKWRLPIRRSSGMPCRHGVLWLRSKRVKRWKNGATLMIGIMPWHRPLHLKDVIQGNSATLVKNPDYWGHDEQNTGNQLPYIDSLKLLIIPDKAAANRSIARRSDWCSWWINTCRSRCN